MDGEYFSAREVARIFGVSYRTVLRWCHRGKIRAMRTPGGHYRIPMDDMPGMSRIPSSITKEEWEKADNG
jgi:excisionase family DNA binding protein